MSLSNFDNFGKIVRNLTFETENNIDDEFICTICRKIIINSHNGPCGCRYCFQCITKYLKEEAKFCPGNLKDCGNELLNLSRNIHYDQSIDIRISRIIMKCPEKLCDCKTELRYIDDHMRVCNFQSIKCPYFSVGCKENKVAYEKLEDHLLSENYNHSKLLIGFIDNLRNEVESLKKIAIELKIENRNLKEEIKEMKLDSEKYKIAISELQNNSDEKTVIGERKQLKNDPLIKDNKEVNLKENLSQLETEKVENLLGKTEYQSQCEWNSKYNEISQKNDYLYMKSNQSDEAIKYIERKCINIEKIQEIQNYGEFLWNIPNFSDKRRDAINGINTTIYSNPFYSHKNGYKMSILICPDGVSVAKSSHLSALFRIMKGSHDDSLLWPFRYNLTLSIINQQTGLCSASHTFTTEAHPNNPGWNKPIKKNNNPIGVYRFINLDELAPNSPVSKGDQIFIKCQVHISS